MNKTIKNILVLILCISVNLIGRAVSGYFDLPVWLDVIGTAVTACVSGPVFGAVCALGTSIASHFLFGMSVWCAFAGVLSALTVSLFASRGYMESFSKAAVSSFWIGILCVVASTPVNILFNKGYPGNIWGDALVDMLKWNNVPGMLSSMAGQAIVDIIDKQFCILCAYLILKFIRTKKKKDISKAAEKASVFLLAFSFLAFECGNEAAYAQIPASENFVQTIYNNTSGLNASEANVITQTNDGNIWIGSYFGLTRYDGTKFEFIRDSGLSSIMAMINDSHGRLWIGTNDSGLARYENGRYSYFKVTDGISGNSVRCFAEDSAGNVYVGTTDGICFFRPDDTIEKLDYPIIFAKSMTIRGDKLIVLDKDGGIHIIDNGTIIDITGDKNKFYTAVAWTDFGLCAGTDDGDIDVYVYSENQMNYQHSYEISDGAITAVFQDSESRVWVGSDKGYEFFEQDGTRHTLTNNGFDSSIDSIYEDYQGNLWFTSSRYGVMKLSESIFVNLFSHADVESSVVNAVASYNGKLYCGTDKGLAVFDQSNQVQTHNDLSRMMENTRIRSVYTDSTGSLWLCTFSDMGLVKYSADGNILMFNTDNCNLSNNRFRCITELSDGTMAAGTSDGIFFFRDDRLISSITSSDGLENSQILSLVQTDDGSLLAGTDGAGIYIISDGRIIDHICTDDGLSSDIILRIVPHEDGYIVVTSNSLCHIDKSYNTERLTDFPYFNNYDVIIDNETAFITCSAGIYRTALSTLCSDGIGQYRLYTSNDGLISGLTANSWNYLSDDGTLYLCSNNGVIICSDEEDPSSGRLKYGVTCIECSGEKYYTEDNGSFTVPESTKQFAAYASVRNFALSDVKVRFFVEELEKDPKTYDWNKIEPIQVTQMDLPIYTIHLQILDSSCENICEEKVFTVIRKAQMWEMPWYRVYLTIVVIEIVLFTIMTIVNMMLSSREKDELERIHLELEDKVKLKTSELREEQKKTRDLFMQTVSALSSAVDAKDKYTSGHSKRVAEYSKMIAERMGKSEEEQEEIYRAGLLHDVGKIRVPGEIINKAGKLTDDEFDLIKIHPATGFQILKKISGSTMIAIGAKFHHERYDGRGYPNGLSGENIPEVARILGVADSYDAMASNRSYRKALPQETVRAEIEKGRGTQFDPNIADIMLQMIDEDKEYTMCQSDSLNKNILVVDDDAMNIRLITHILKDEPMYTIISASSGKKAIELATTDEIHLILLDVNMPEMDGFETLKALRENGCTVPVVFVTGDKKLDIIEKAQELGCDDFITKPFQPLLIKEVIHSITDK